MNFPEGMFDKMKFPIHGLSLDVDLLEEFPILKTFGEFRIESLRFELDEDNVIEFRDISQLIRYVFYCYDKNISWDTPDLDTKKKECGKLVSLSGDKLDVVMKNLIPEVNKMIVVFSKLQNNRMHRWNIMAEELYDQNMSRIMEPISTSLDDDKSMRASTLKAKLLDDCKNMGKDLDKNAETLYGSLDEANEITAEFVPYSPETLEK